MEKIPQITDSELEVMKVVWAAGSMPASTIIEKLTPVTTWKDKTVQTLINRLVKKNALTVDKSQGKAYVYSAAVSAEAYREQANKNFLQRLYDGSLDLMLLNFVKNNKLSQDEINSLKKILDENTDKE